MSSKAILNITIIDEYQDFKMVDWFSWNGVIYIGHRKHLTRDNSSLYSMPECEYLAEHPGVYFLLGKDSKTNKKKLYIGESEDVIKRLKDHTKDVKKNWFEDFMVFTTNNGKLNKAHIKHIEADFIELFKEHFSHICLDNSCGSNTKKRNRLPYSDSYIAEEFKNKVIYILKHLNLIDLSKPSSKKDKKIRQNKKVALPKTSVSHKTNITNIKQTNNQLIFFKNLPNQPKHFQAKMVISNNKYILLKDSYIIKNPKESFKTSTYYKHWIEVTENYCRVAPDNPNCYITTTNISCNSPSKAGSIVNAYPTSGRIEWKLEDGTILKEYQSKNV